MGWIVQELRELPAQSADYSDVPDDPRYVGSYFESMYNAGYLLGSVNADTRSFLLAAKAQPWYANRYEVSEIILWVPERFRGSRTALSLIKHFTETVRMMPEVHSIHVGASLDITSADVTMRLYELCGYTRKGDGASMRL